MKIYLEFIFLINFLLDFMILYGTKRILKVNKGIGRLILGGIIGSFTTFLLFFSLNSFELFLFKILFSTIIICISFGFSNFFQNLFYFYFISIILGGTIYLFDFSVHSYLWYLFLVVGSFFVIGIVVKEFLRYKEKFINKYPVTIYYQEKHYQLDGFIDTGNQLVSPFKKESIILVNLSITSNKMIYVPYQALNTTGVIPCIRPDKVLINHQEFSNCLIGLAKDKFQLDGVNCILPNKFKEELC